MEIHIDQMETPIGNIVLAVTAEALVGLDFDETVEPALARLTRRYGDFQVTTQPWARGFRDRLESYFGGDLHAIHGLAVEPRGTAFQREVWSALQLIPVGTTVCYSDIAATIGRPAAVRAVGLANGSNPIAVVIPCHRVVGRDGSLTGYGGGLERKRWLLRHEGCSPQRELQWR